MQMVRNILAEGAAISVLVGRLGVERIVVDAGVAGELPAVSRNQESDA